MRVAGVCLAPDVAPSFRIRSYVGMLNRGVLFGPSALRFLLPNPKFRIAGTKTMKGVYDWPWGPEAADLTYLEMTASTTAPSTGRLPRFGIQQEELVRSAASVNIEKDTTLACHVRLAAATPRDQCRKLQSSNPA